MWTIAELGAEVARALSAGYEEPVNRQIRAIPDRRTIRYYTTLGLLDGPARMRGRTALYGHRHLLQVVAIKRLQARGMALAAIQEELAGLPDAGLAALARLSLDAPQEQQAARNEPDGRRRQRFWEETPAIAEAAAAPPPMEPPAAPAPRFTPMTALSLAPGATLMLDTQCQPNEEDLRRIETAAKLLVNQLKDLGLLPESDDPNLKGVTP